MKFKRIPSINRIGGHNPNIPAPVILSRGTRKQGNGRAISPAMHDDSRTIGAGEPINESTPKSVCKDFAFQNVMSHFAI